MLYLFILLAFALLLYLSPFAILRLPGFERWSSSYEGKNIEYGFTTKVNADVVVFGESSAMMGIDPRTISSAIDQKVVNLPNTLGSLIVSGELQLQHYLRTNRRPKLLIIYLAPFNLDYAHIQHLANLYEGEEMLVRHGTVGDIFRFARSHSLEILQFPFRFYAVNSFPAMAKNLSKPITPSKIAIELGHTEEKVNFGTLKSTCSLPASFTNKEASMESVQRLVRRYGGSADRIMVFVAPIPSCGGTLTFLSLPYGELHAEPPKFMPPNSFWDDGYYIHLTPAAVPEATGELIVAIRSFLGVGLSSSGRRAQHADKTD